MSIRFVTSEDDFSSSLKRNKYLMANFTASWCGPCQAIKPKIDDLYVDTNYKSIEIVRVDLDSQQSLASKYRVLSVPTFIFFYMGKEVNRVRGANIGNVIQGMDRLKKTTKATKVSQETANANAMSSINSTSLLDMIKNIPPVTRFFTVSTVLLCFIIKSGHFDSFIFASYPKEVIFSWVPMMITEYEHLKLSFGKLLVVLKFLFKLHAFFTTFLVPEGISGSDFGSDFGPILSIYFFYNFSQHLESRNGKFRGNFPDFVWFMFFCGAVIVFETFIIYFVVLKMDEQLAFWLLNLTLYHSSLLACITYIWSRESKDLIITFLGLFPIRAYYLPWFNAAVSFMSNGYFGLTNVAIGVWSGYIYQCVQSGTFPIYNLFPNSYRSHALAVSSGRRLNKENEGESFNDQIFDLGYLAAPNFLYKMLRYPIPEPHQRADQRSGNVKEGSAKSSGYSRNTELWSNFQGKGHKLGT